MTPEKIIAAIIIAATAAAMLLIGKVAEEHAKVAVDKFQIIKMK